MAEEISITEFLINLTSGIVGKDPNDVGRQGGPTVWYAHELGGGEQRFDVIIRSTFPPSDANYRYAWEWEAYGTIQLHERNNYTGDDIVSDLLWTHMDPNPYDDFQYLAPLAGVPPVQWQIEVNKHRHPNDISSAAEYQEFVQNLTPTIQRWYDIKLETWKRKFSPPPKTT